MAKNYQQNKIGDKILIICSSPYTIFNSLNFILSNHMKEKKKVDLLIFHKTNYLADVSAQLKKLDYFENIYDYKDIQSLKALPVIVLIIMFFPRIMFKFLALEKATNQKLDNYSMILSQNYFFALLLGQLNKKASLYLLEEGTGSYAGRTSLPRERSKYFLLAKKIFKENFISEIKGQFVYKPDLVLTGHLKPIQLLPIQQQHIQIYKKVFNYKDNTLYYNHRFILFGDGEMEVPILNLGQSLNNMNKYDVYNQLLLNILPSNNTIYRKHPVETIFNAQKAFGQVEIDQINNLWELECLEQITNEHVLISFFSTATLSPKILYNKEPYLVFLSGISEPDNVRCRTLDFINRVRQIYSNPDKILMIENISELKNKLTSFI